MILPEYIKIGYKKYKVRNLDKNVGDLCQAFGATSHNESLIFSDDTRDERENLNTLVHEVLHGVCFVFSLGKSKEEEEQIVNLLANGLVGVLIDNPELLEYINSSVEEINEKEKRRKKTSRRKSSGRGRRNPKKQGKAKR
jgi:hypothetical protein